MRVALPIPGEGGDDDSTSPHVNTFRDLNKSPPPFASSPNPSTESITSGDHEDHQSDMNDEDDDASQIAQEDTKIGQEDGPGKSVLELRLDESDGAVKNTSPLHMQCNELKLPTEGQVLQAKSPVDEQAEDTAPEFLSSNTSMRHTRKLSSSIPHLLSNAASSIGGESSASIHANNETNPPMQHQFSFAGLDAVLPSLEVDRLTDMPFPLDGNTNASTSGYVLSHNNLYNTTTPPVQPTMNPARVISPLHLATSFSQTSSHYSTTPPMTGMMIPAPPSLTPSLTPSSQLQFGVPPAIHLEGGHQPTISPARNSNYLPITQQQLQQPQPNRTRVQPVLYSAINSLEKYNAGSFDKRMMLAKARGKKAFPGVPTNQQPQGMGTTGYAIDGGAEESKTSALSSGMVAGRTTAQKTIHEGTTYNNSMNQSKQGDGLSLKTGAGLRSTTHKGSGGIIKSRSDQNLDGDSILRRNTKPDKSVTIDQSVKKSKRREKKIGVFRPSCDAYTPRMANKPIKYKPAQERTSVEKMSTTMGTIQRPNFRDALRRVAIILHQHITKIEQRFETGVRGADDTGLFKASMREVFNEDLFVTPRYRCCMVRVPMARPGVVYSMRKIRTVYNTPTTDEIYDFAHQLFKKVQLSSECSIVCLIYVEKLMEVAKVPLMPDTWRPIFMCGLLLASKVWQDLSSWNIEFASVYPQFSLEAINRLELQFLKLIKWDLYISSSLYAKYYFALRSLLEKSGFRNRYNQMVGGIGGIASSEAMKVSKRSEAVKEEALLHLSRSM